MPDIGDRSREYSAENTPQGHIYLVYLPNGPRFPAGRIHMKDTIECDLCRDMRAWVAQPNQGDILSFKAMLDRSGVPYITSTGQHRGAWAKSDVPGEPGTSIVISADPRAIDAKVEGWGFMYVVFSFNPEGMLTKVGIWE